MLEQLNITSCSGLKEHSLFMPRGGGGLAKNGEVIKISAIEYGVTKNNPDIGWGGGGGLAFCLGKK